MIVSRVDGDMGRAVSSDESARAGCPGPGDPPGDVVTVPVPARLAGIGDDNGVEGCLCCVASLGEKTDNDDLEAGGKKESWDAGMRRMVGIVGLSCAGSSDIACPCEFESLLDDSFPLRSD